MVAQEVEAFRAGCEIALSKALPATLWDRLGLLRLCQPRPST